MQYGIPHIPRDLYTAGAVVVDSRPLAQMLYMENKQRLARQQQEDKELDKLTQGSLGGVFAPDQADAVKKYQTWHDSRTRVLHDKKLRRDRVGYAQAQSEEKKNFQDFMDFAAKSKQRHEFVKEVRGLKPDERDDAYGQNLQAYSKTPMLKLPEDLSNTDTYRYMGLDYDATKLNETARGKEVDAEMDGGPSAPESMTKKINIYSRRENNPAQMESIYFNAASEQKGKKYLRAQAAMLTPDTMNQIDEAIANVPDDVWKVMGGKADLSVKHPELPESVAANYLAKKTFLENLPRLKKTEDRLDVDKKMKADQAFTEKMAKMKHKWDTDEIYLKDSLETAKGADADNKIEGYMQQLESEAKAAGIKRKDYDIKNGKEINNHPYVLAPLTSTLAKAFERVDKYGYKVQPQELGIDDKGNFIPIFYEQEVIKEKDGKGKETGKESLQFKKDKNGSNFIDRTLSKPIPRALAKTDIANAFLTPKLTEAAMPSPAGSNASPSSAPTKTKKTTVIKLKTGSLDSL
jgi:hypothetical protein